MVSYSKRAISDLQKAERREVILQAALSCFERDTFADLTMAAVARAAEVSKGTLYLYFQSKEELFLQALLGLYADWFAVLEGPRGKSDLVELVAESLVERPKLLELMSMAPAVMEANAPLAAVVAFKQSLAHSLDRLSLHTGVEPRRLLWIHAGIVGLYATANPPTKVRQALAADPRLQVFDLDFQQELRELLRCLV